MRVIETVIQPWSGESSSLCNAVRFALQARIREVLFHRQRAVVGMRDNVWRKVGRRSAIYYGQILAQNFEGYAGTVWHSLVNYKCTDVTDKSRVYPTPPQIHQNPVRRVPHRLHSLVGEAKERLSLCRTFPSLLILSRSRKLQRVQIRRPCWGVRKENRQRAKKKLETIPFRGAQYADLERVIPGKYSWQNRGDCSRICLFRLAPFDSESATPVSGSAIFFITFLISYPPASVTVIQIPIVIYVDINGNPSVSWRPPPSLLRSPSSSRYYALLNQSCHCYCCLLAVLPCPARFFD